MTISGLYTLVNVESPPSSITWQSSSKNGAMTSQQDAAHHEILGESGHYPKFNEGLDLHNFDASLII